jgi:hypothetical protein
MLQNFPGSLPTAILFAVLLAGSLERAAKSSYELTSPAFFSRSDYSAAPKALGELLFTHADVRLSANEVREIARGFARLNKEGEDWIENFVEGYQRRAERQNDPSASEN